MASSVLLHTVSQSRIDLLSPSGGQIQTMYRRFGRKIFKSREVRDTLPGTVTPTMMRNARLPLPSRKTYHQRKLRLADPREALEWLFSGGKPTHRPIPRSKVTKVFSVRTLATFWRYVSSRQDRRMICYGFDAVQKIYGEVHLWYMYHECHKAHYCQGGRMG